MPAPKQFDAIVADIEAVVPLSRGAAAQTCVLERDRFTCTCVVGGSLLVGETRPDGAASVYWTEDDLEVWLADYDIDSRTARGVVMRRGDDVVRAASAAHREGRWALEEVSFGPATGGADRSTCGAPLAPTLDVSATAAAAIQTPEGFALQNYEVGIIPIGDIAPGEPSSGFLPPAIRTDGDAFELEAAGYVAPYGALVAVAAPGDWYGGGARFFSEHESLDLQARYDTASGFEPFAWGDYTLGAGRQHLDLQLEHPATFRQAELRRVETDAFLRGYRRSAIGANLSGASYGFRIDGNWISSPGMESDGEITADFGGRAEVGGGLRLDFDLDHRSITLDGESSHSTTAVALLSAPIGSTRRIWLTPGASLYTNYGVIPAQLGFEASASGGVGVDLEAGASWTGRFRDWTHRFTPGLRVGRELAGIAQRAPLPADAPDYLFARVEGFTWYVARLENEIVGDNLRLSFPVGVVGRGAGADGLPSPQPYARVATTIGKVGVNGALVCESGCSDVSWSGETHGNLAWLGWRLGLSDASLAGLRTLAGPRLFTSPAATVLLSQPLPDSSDVVGRASVSTLLGPLAIGATATFDREEVEGIQARATWPLRPLGLSLAAQGGWYEPRDAWTAMIGLSTNR